MTETQRAAAGVDPAASAAPPFVAPDPAIARRATILAMLVVTTYAISFGIVGPVLPRLIMELGDVPLSRATTIGGILTAVYGVAQFLCSPIMGALGDRFGRRPIILVAMAGFAVDYLLMAFAPTLAWLFLGRMIAGGLGAVFAPAQAIIADVTAPADRARKFGLVGAAFGAGFVIGPGVGGLIAGLGTRAPFFASAALAAFAFLFALFLFRETLPPERRRPFSLTRSNPFSALYALARRRDLNRLALGMLLWMLAANIYPALWAYFATERFGWTPRLVGISMTAVGLSMLLVQTLLLGRLIARLGQRGTMMLGIAGAGAIFAAHAVNADPRIALFLCAIVGIQGVVQPALNATLSATVDEREQGEVLGLSSSLAALSIVTAPLTYNPLMERFAGAAAPVYWPGAPFALSALLCVAALLVLRRATRPDDAKAIAKQVPGD